MANAIPIRVPGNGTSTLEYVLPANMMQFVQSVNAVIDNGGGGAANPVLTVLDSSNEVVADVEQGRSIPAGESDARSTWALGLREQQAPTGDASAYVFVNEITLGPGSGSFSFGAIPQDARHLVIFVQALGSNCKLRFNGDFAGGHYHTITSRLRDNNGVLTSTDAISGVTDGVDLACLNTDVAGARAVITIPYYRSALFNDFTREAEIEAVVITGSAAPHQWVHWKVAGFWFVDNTPRPPITAITINSLAGFGGKASLYKVM